MRFYDIAMIFLYMLHYIVNLQIMKKAFYFAHACTVKKYFMQMLISHQLFNISIFYIQYNVHTTFDQGLKVVLKMVESSDLYKQKNF